MMRFNRILLTYFLYDASMMNKARACMQCCRQLVYHLQLCVSQVQSCPWITDISQAAGRLHSLVSGSDPPPSAEEPESREQQGHLVHEMTTQQANIS